MWHHLLLLASILHSCLNMLTLPQYFFDASPFLPQCSCVVAFLCMHPWMRSTAGLSMLPYGTGLAVAVGLPLWGFSTWWLVVAICSVCQTMRVGLPFNLGWWGSVFPLGVYTGEWGLYKEIGGSYMPPCSCIMQHCSLLSPSPKS